MKKKPDLEDVLQKLKENAESENYHDFYQIYDQIAEIVEKHAGREAALKVMMDITDRNGFMN